MKKYLLMTLCTFVSSVSFCGLLYPQEQKPDVRARAALALAQTKPSTAAKAGCGCSCAERGCVCSFPGECGDPGCCCAAKNPLLLAKGQSLSTTSLEQGIAEAVRRKTHLVLWVGEMCPPCEKKLAGYVHCRVTEYSGEKGVETGPEVIVCRRQGEDFIIVARIEGIPADLAERVRDALAPSPKTSDPRDDPTYDNVNPYNRNPHWPYKSVSRAVPVVQDAFGDYHPGTITYGTSPKHAYSTFTPFFFPLPPMTPMGGFGGGGGGCGG